MPLISGISGFPVGNSKYTAPPNTIIITIKINPLKIVRFILSSPPFAMFRVLFWYTCFLILLNLSVLFYLWLLLFIVKFKYAQ